MPTSIGHSTRYPRSVADIRAMFTNEQYWKDRLAEVGGPGARLVGITGDGDHRKVEMVQSIAEEDLPSAITKVRPGDLVINRSETWGPTSATFHAEVEGAPAKITGAVVLSGEGAATTAQTDGAVEVNIPLFGGKIEKAIADRLNELFEKEDEFTNGWLAEHP